MCSNLLLLGSSVIARSLGAMPPRPAHMTPYPHMPHRFGVGVHGSSPKAALKKQVYTKQGATNPVASSSFPMERHKNHPKTLSPKNPKAPKQKTIQKPLNPKTLKQRRKDPCCGLCSPAAHSTRGITKIRSWALVKELRLLLLIVVVKN